MRSGISEALYGTENEDVVKVKALDLSDEKTLHDVHSEVEMEDVIILSDSD